MFKPTANLIPRFSLLFAIVSLAACGGGGSSDGGSAPVPDAVNDPGTPATAVKPGLFLGTLSSESEGSVEARALVSSTGKYAIFTGSLTGIFGTLTQTFRGDESLSGDGTSLFFDETWQSNEGSLEGSVTGSEEFTATFTPDMADAGMSSDMTAIRSDAASDLQVTMEDLEGIYFLSGTNPTSVTIDPEGAVIINDSSSGCNIEGAITIPDPAYNIFEGNLSLSNCSAIEGVPAEQRNGDYSIIGYLLILPNDAKNLVFAGTNGNAIFSFSGSN